MNTDIVERVQQWAVMYLEYGDDSSLGFHDKELVDGFVDKLLKDGLRLAAPVEGSESKFEPHPALRDGVRHHRLHNRDTGETS